MLIRFKHIKFLFIKMSLNNEVISDEELNLSDEENIVEAYVINFETNIAYPEMTVLAQIKSEKSQFLKIVQKILRYFFWCIIISICVILYIPFLILDYLFCCSRCNSSVDN